jgi:hypothetical protein
VAAEAITRDARFRELATRVRLRALAETVRLGSSAALVGAALVSLVGKIAGLEAWPQVAVVWVAVAVLGSALYALVRAPDGWAVAQAADGLGLAERISSAMYAQARQASVAELLTRDAHASLARLEPTRYAIVADRRAWRALALGVVTLLVLIALPIPRFGSDASKAQDTARLASAQERVAAIELQAAKDPERSVPLSEKTKEKLQALRDALARSETSADAAMAIETTQRQLAQLPGADNYAARRGLDAIATSLESQRDQALIPLARALRNRDAQAASQALADLSARVDQPGAMTDAERAQLRSELQTAANAAAGSQPRLAAALRRAASSSGLNSDELQDLLSQTAADAAALEGVERALGDLGRLRATTLPPGATLVPARGTPTAYVLVRGTPPPNATLIGVPANGSGTGQSGIGPQGSGAGQSGIGPQGSGAGGGGAGYGDTPSQGRPSDESQQSATGSQAGQRVAPNSATPSVYDAVYAPSHLGGEGGPALQPGGDPTGARGAGVDLPEGPLTVGDVRPYDQVYAQYAQEARQSTSRQSLPPNVQNMVDRYFGSIAPPTSGPGP